MKKLLLFALLVFSVLGLSSCGVKAKELKVSGDTAKTKDFTNFEKDFDKYYETNEVGSQWYSIKISTTAETKDSITTTVITGVYYHSRFAFERKIKLNATIEYEGVVDKKEVKTTKKITYVAKEGKEYSKVETEGKREGYKYSSTEYLPYAAAELEVALIFKYIFDNPSMLIDIVGNQSKMYKLDNGFAGETEGKKETSQAIYKYKSSKCYDLKSYEYYSYKEATKTDVTETYISISTKLFGRVGTPSHPERYQEGN